jgi:hypothetical protein
VQAAFEYSVQITAPEKHSGIRASSVMLFVYDRRLDEARKLLRTLEGRHMLSDFHIRAMRGALEGAERGEAA